MAQLPLYDVIIIGAGTAGLPAAICAAERGAKVLVIEAAADIGGTLHWSSAQMSAAGTRRQKERGIDDNADLHFADVMRISNGNANPVLARLAVDQAAATLDWLDDLGFDFDPVCPTIFYGHQAYGKPRTYWGRDLGLSLIALFRPMLETQIRAGRVTLWLSTRFQSFEVENGAVIGVNAVRANGSAVSARGKSVVLTSGGYAANTDLYREIQNRTQYQKAFCPTARGDGLVAARGIGAKVINGHLYTISTLTVLKDDVFPSPLSLRVNTIPQNRPPWEIWVNDHGERFVAEDEPIIDKREKALEAQPHKRMWIVFDDVIRRDSPDIVLAWFEPPMTEPYNTHKAFFKADTPEALAKLCGLPPAALAATIADYNKGRADDADRFGRGHMPRSISQGPFYAIRQQGGALSTTGGLAIDGALRVLNTQSQPIANLYAAGEVIGAGQTMGDAAVGGMMVTPALTFGRLLGQTILRW
ncbi:MAG: FAD-dependent oxidoreductase [Rhodospirillaceae bacterium]|nr:FAD-dependent oxidoreductase [Rhodospirillaceae bacterium]